MKCALHKNFQRPGIGFSIIIFTTAKNHFAAKIISCLEVIVFNSTEWTKSNSGCHRRRGKDASRFML